MTVMELCLNIKKMFPRLKKSLSVCLWRSILLMCCLCSVDCDGDEAVGCLSFFVPCSCVQCVLAKRFDV